MKDKFYTSIICEKFCSYYKPKDENQYCEGYSFLRRNLTSNELKDLVTIFKLSERPTSETKDYSLCSSCEFRIDGCDFYVNQSNIPCGGFLIINKILNLY